mmetsp:Transcript_40130/g.90048  ORF Transcript_40130/g.90048 Transcript_40130/m.90048 type:complete len:285 (+) Transcript_40130:1827-2681(+)
MASRSTASTTLCSSINRFTSAATSRWLSRSLCASPRAPRPGLGPSSSTSEPAATRRASGWGRSGAPWTAPWLWSTRPPPPPPSECPASLPAAAGARTAETMPLAAEATTAKAGGSTLWWQSNPSPTTHFSPAAAAAARAASPLACRSLVRRSAFSLDSDCSFLVASPCAFSRSWYPLARSSCWRLSSLCSRPSFSSCFEVSCLARCTASSLVVEIRASESAASSRSLRSAKTRRSCSPPSCPCKSEGPICDPSDGDPGASPSRPPAGLLGAPGLAAMAEMRSSR